MSLERPRPQVLIVEDDPMVAAAIRQALGGFGFIAELARTATQLLQRLQGTPPALLILDLGLPDGDGLDLVREIRARSRIPIIVVSGRDDTADRVLALELGADDYLTKPFEPRELVARIRAVLRRCNPEPSAGTPNARRYAHFAGFIYDAMTLQINGANGFNTTLSVAESALLRVFLASPNQLLSRDALAGRTDRSPLDRTTDLRISRLRRKLGDDVDEPRLIRTVYGAGYLLFSDVVWSDEDPTTPSPPH